MKRYVYNVREDRKLKLEKAALEVGNKIGRPINWTKIIETLIDKHTKDGIESLIYEEKQNTNNWNNEK